MARILVIEDEEKIARMLSRALREEGYSVEAAGVGREGFSRALDGSFDLHIVDWMLPERSGVQVIRGLRAAEVGTSVLMLAAREQIEDRVEGLAAGAPKTPPQTLLSLGAFDPCEGSYPPAAHGEQPAGEAAIRAGCRFLIKEKGRSPPTQLSGGRKKQAHVPQVGGLRSN